MEAFEETEWSIFLIRCDFDNEYAILSKYPLESGKTCSRCNRSKLQVLFKLPDTKENRDLIHNRRLELWKFAGQGELARIE